MLPIHIYSEDGLIPSYAKDGDSGVDILAKGFSIIDENPFSLRKTNVTTFKLISGARVLVHTGLYMEIPCGYECQVRPRSGLALKYGITVVNTPGTIDSSYRGECNIILINHSKYVMNISLTDKIAQFVFAPIARVTFVSVLSLEALSTSSRGTLGFGSTGV